MPRDRYGDYPPKERLEAVVGSKGNVRNNMRNLYHELSAFIHAERAADEKEARDLLERSQRAIEYLENTYG